MNYLNKLLHKTALSAKHYDKVAQLPQTVAERLLARINYMRITPRNIIDLGCGTAYLTSLLQKHFPQANTAAIDISTNMLQHSSTTKKICADAHQLPFADHSIDLICSTFLLEWSQNILALLSEIKRILTPGGVFLFATLGPDTLTELRRTWHALVETHHVNAFIDMHDLGDMLLKLKFENPVMDREDFTLLYPNVKLLLKELKQLGSFKTAPHIHPGLTGKSIFKQLAEHYPQNEQSLYPATFEVIYGHAFGSQHSLQDEQAGISRIPIREITKK